jgi:general secretion pathway protein H
VRTPTSGTRPELAGAAAGFTLIELLAVLSILAIAITAFSYNITPSADTAKFRALIIRTAGLIGQGRTDAMREMTDKVFYIDFKNRRIGYPGSGNSIDIPPGIDLTVTAAESEKYPDGTLGIRFYPSGGSTGGVLNFAFRGSNYVISVNWLTGNVSLGPA